MEKNHVAYCCSFFFLPIDKEEGREANECKSVITSIGVNVYDGRADMRIARPFSQIIVFRRHYRQFTFSRDADVIWPQNLSHIAPKCADVFFKCKLVGFYYFLRSTFFWITTKACLDRVCFSQPGMIVHILVEWTNFYFSSHDNNKISRFLSCIDSVLCT